MRKVWELVIKNGKGKKMSDVAMFEIERLEKRVFELEKKDEAVRNRRALFQYI